jgi:plasmid stabilization system protein ParE
MNQIIWKDTAKQDYWQNIDYLLERWTATEAENFIQTVEEHLNIIKKKPYTFQKANYRDTYYVVIVKQITLYYSIDDNKVNLLRFWNNAKDPNTFSL